MPGRFTFNYDRDGDVMSITTCPPYPEQESEDIGDEIIARINPTTGEVESLEILFFFKRLEAGEPIEARVDAAIRIVN
jgi:hypothetical protein